jgi:hypothetical protein
MRSKADGAGHQEVADQDGEEVAPVGWRNNRSLTIQAHDLSRIRVCQRARATVVCDRDGAFVLLTGDGYNLLGNEGERSTGQ